MGHRVSQYVVLCEDLQSQVFLRRALIERGAHPRSIRTRPLPAMAQGGAGEQFVRLRYADEVAACRTRSAGTALVVHVDADTTDVADRHRMLAGALADAGLAPRAATEPVVLLVPKRNVETWIYVLGGDAADEVSSYPRLRGRERDCGPAAQRFATCARSGTSPSPTVPSLDAGLAEFRRLPTP